VARLIGPGVRPEDDASHLAGLRSRDIDTPARFTSRHGAPGSIAAALVPDAAQA